jgi:hypothetical protein
VKIEKNKLGYKMRIEGKEEEELFRKIERIDGIVFIRNKGIRSSCPFYKTSIIIFRDRNGKEINFNDLLPNGYEFVSFEEKRKLGKAVEGEGMFKTDHSKKIIFYGDLSQNGALFSLLHEIGHAWLEEESENVYTIIEDYIFNYENRKLTEADIKARGEDPQNYIEIMVYDAYGKWEDGEENWFPMLIPKEIIKKYGRAWAEHERRC